MELLVHAQSGLKGPQETEDSAPSVKSWGVERAISRVKEQSMLAGDSVLSQLAGLATHGEV